MNNSVIQVRVAARHQEALDICSFELVEVNGAVLPAFSAGSHVDVELPGGLTRQYSLCNDPGERHRYQIAVLKDPVSRGGSRTLHETLREGDTLQISHPTNHFALAHDAGHHVLVAGGIGVTPLLCMAERLALLGASFEMHYCTRSVERTAFRERIRAATFADRVHFHHDDGASAQKLDLAALVEAPRPGVHLYVCGPKGFMDAVLGAARAAGWPEAQLHFEFFGAEVVHDASDGSFQVKLASTGQVVTVGPEETVVQALAAVGVAVSVSCEQGVCGTCLTRVLSGTIDHRDLFLMSDEQARNDQFTPCCSRAKSPMLVLDL